METNRRILVYRGMYILIGIVIMICLGTIYSWSIFRSFIENEFKIGTFLSGMPYMLALALYSAFVMITGRHIEKHSPKNIISLGAILVGVGWILAGFSNNILQFAISYGVIGGIGVGIIYGVPMNIAAKWFPDRKGLFIGLVLAGFGMSSLVMAPFAKYLIYEYGVMKSFTILGCLFGIIIFILSRFLRYPNKNEIHMLETLVSVKHIRTTEIQIETKEMIKTSNFKWIYFNFFIATTIGLMLIGLTSSIGVNYAKVDAKTVAIMISVFAIFNGIGRPIFGQITDKIGSKKAMIISYLLILIASIIMVFAGNGNVLMFAIAFSIFWFNLGGWLSIAPTSILNMFGNLHYGRNYGVTFTAYGIGAIIGVSCSGILIDVFNNYTNIFYLIICLCCIGIVTSNRFINEKKDLR